MKNKGLSGFSLVEILVVMAVSAIIGLAMIELTVNQTRQQKIVEYSSDFNNTMNAIQALINNESACASVFDAMNLNFTGVATNIASLSYSGSTIITRNAATPTAPGISYPTLSLSGTGPSPITISSVNYTRYQGTLAVVGRKWIRSTSGAIQQVGGNMSKNFRLNILTNSAGDIKFCYASSSTTADDQHFCEVVMGGRYDSTSTPPCWFDRFASASAANVHSAGFNTVNPGGMYVQDGLSVAPNGSIYLGQRGIITSRSTAVSVAPSGLGIGVVAPTVDLKTNATTGVLTVNAPIRVSIPASNTQGGQTGNVLHDCRTAAQACAFNPCTASCAAGEVVVGGGANCPAGSSIDQLIPVITAGTSQIIGHCSVAAPMSVVAVCCRR